MVHAAKWDYVKAFEWCHKAAQQGQCDAQSVLSKMYDVGKGVEQDYAKSAEWYDRFMNCEVIE